MKNITLGLLLASVVGGVLGLFWFVARGSDMLADAVYSWGGTGAVQLVFGIIGFALLVLLFSIFGWAINGLSEEEEL